MAGLELVLILLAASVALRIFAERFRIPYPTLLVLGGLALAMVPNLPRIQLDPDALFLIFVPPLLYWGAVSFPLRDLKQQIGPILRLSVLMVFVSTAVVAVVVHAIDPAFTWAAAFTLGAIVAPPDPVAVISLMRWVRLPREVSRILEGEGMLNDASALVAYRMAVAAAVTGVFSLWHAAGLLIAASLGGLIIGLVVGYIALLAHKASRSVDVAEITVSLLTPFAAYLAAEAVGGSGIVSVVTAAMLIARNLYFIGNPATRVETADAWGVVTFLLESLVFVLIGLELPLVTRGFERGMRTDMLREAAIVCACVVAVRMVWLFPSAYIGRRIDAWFRGSNINEPGWRSVFFVGWAGVRGGDSLVIALALPLTTAAGQPFPARERIIFLTFCVILATLVVQAPTLRRLAKLLRLESGPGAVNEEVHARLVSAQAGLKALDRSDDDSTFPEVARYLRQRHRQRARRWAAAEEQQHLGHDHMVTSPRSHEGGALDVRRAVEYSRLRVAMIRAERTALVQLRDDGQIGDDVMRGLQRELDLEEMLASSSQPVVEPPGEV